MGTKAKLVKLIMKTYSKRTQNGLSSQQVTHAEQSAEEEARIVGIEEAPHFLIDNKYLLTGYRKNFRRMKHIFKSLFMPHNETFNIWTHLLGLLFLVGFQVFFLTQYLPIDSIKTHLSELIANDQRLTFELERLKSSTGHCASSMLLGRDSDSSTPRTSLSSPNINICSYMSSIQSLTFDHAFHDFHSSFSKIDELAALQDGGQSTLFQLKTQLFSLVAFGVIHSSSSMRSMRNSKCGPSLSTC